MSVPVSVLFFANGNTAVFQNSAQVPELQQSWLLRFVEFLEANGVDPLKSDFTMPDGRRAYLFKTGRGYNWSME